MPTAALADVHGNLRARRRARRSAAGGGTGPSSWGTSSPVRSAETLDRLTAAGPRLLPAATPAARARRSRRLVRLDSGSDQNAGGGAVVADILDRRPGSGQFAVATPSVRRRACPDPDTPETDFAGESRHRRAIVVGGHTHVQFDRSVGPWRYVNVGAVGRPYEGRPSAYWAMLGRDIIVRTDFASRQRPRRFLLGTAQCGGGRRDIASSAHAERPRPGGRSLGFRDDGAAARSSSTA
jgi:hypothetical protein